MANDAKAGRSAKRDAGHHDRRLARRLQEDAEFRGEYERASQEVAAIDAIVRMLDDLREAHGLSKADLARAIGKNPASIRRLLTSRGNPELRTVVAIAAALDAEVKIVPRRRAKAKLQRGRTAAAA
ncbi:MAG: helix-turn-helix transcriptional regulator [Actinobacteria bacterium]|nr:helix-turn-helix transcriptional regulator [Actinomycetota bacterium]